MWCPLIAAALISNGGKNSVDQVRGTTFLDCQEFRCQMWDSQRNDCGLKDRTLLEIKDHLDDISRTLSDIGEDISLLANSN